MTEPLWLRPSDCPLLQPHLERVDLQALRQVQRLLELGLARPGCDELARTSLEEIAAALRADLAVVVEARPDWPARWQHVRRGLRFSAEQLPRPLLAEVLDREAGVSRPPGAGTPALLAVCLSYTERLHRVLVV